MIHRICNGRLKRQQKLRISGSKGRATVIIHHKEFLIYTSILGIVALIIAGYIFYITFFKTPPDKTKEKDKWE